MFATDAQLKYAKALIADRNWMGNVSDQVGYTIERIIKDEPVVRLWASRTIDALKGCTIKQAAKPEPSPRFIETGRINAYAEDMANLQAALRQVPTGKYALIEKATGEVAFFEIVQRRKGGHIFLNKLIGAPGDYLRIRLTVELQAAALRAITLDTLASVKLFSKEANCCARCMAPLTDSTSRKLGLGPKCRKAHGL